MSANFYELLKYAATGIASPDMTAYDKMRASTLMGGVVRTLTGQPPLTFKADGSPLISWSMKGNGEQTGTPTPDNPIQPEFVGVRTGNLFDKTTITSGNYATVSGTTANQSYYCSDFIPITAATYYFQNAVGGSYQNTVVVYDANKQGLRYAKLSGSDKASGAITFQSGDAYIRVNFYHQTDVGTVMVNLGSATLPYEPYGWELPLTNAGQTVPIYLGEVPTVRRVRKLTLSGNENWVGNAGDYYADGVTDYLHTDYTVFCTHFPTSPNVASRASAAENSLCFGKGTLNRIFFKWDLFATVNDLIGYLASEYAAGTPVTVWYVLANEQTGIVNEPLCKIGDYADELHSEDAGVTIPTAKGENTLTVDTELQPSEMTITFKG